MSSQSDALASDQQSVAPRGTGSRGRGRPGGADSRERILTSAGKLFAARGYNGVSMRDLARAAKVNLGAISYHFGGKAALYHETVQLLIDDMGPLFGPIIIRLREGVVAAAGDRNELARAAKAFVEEMVPVVLGPQRRRWQMAFLMREFHQPSREFPLLMAERINPMHDAVGMLVAAAIEAEPDTPDVRIRTAAIIGQVMSFEAVRVAVCARLGWKDYSKENSAIVSKALVPMILGSLGLPLHIAESRENT